MVMNTARVWQGARAARTNMVSCLTQLLVLLVWLLLNEEGQEPQWGLPGHQN